MERHVLPTVADENPFAVPLAIVRVCSPAVICLATVSLFFSLPERLAASEPCPIGSTVTILLLRVAFTFLLEGLIEIVFAIVSGVWQPCVGCESAALLGIAGCLALCVVGRQKEKDGEEVWTLSRVRCALSFAAILDLTQVLLWVLSINEREVGDICHDNRRGACMSESLHLWVPAVRVMMFGPLLVLLSLVHISCGPTEDQLGGESGERERLLEDAHSCTADMRMRGCKLNLVIFCYVSNEGG
ncbi:hypothetical protein PAXRUDRAFT_137765 [Paxillus rubicundulus Ve08.2h10]|uniref:Transmembrane protein n=1 Tax=Paxillus rubicundulus Ve08.2h10 TaxID=930991 RepID=A0A0D0DSY1_9AGAM|nr:hypothetical protein PAXRUDRAFT_137765 [Paxillus rubicundulus Ve08.2h10]